jgi:hypothetical protein
VGRSHETTSHNTTVFDFTHFSRSQRSNSINWPLFVPGAYLLKHWCKAFHLLVVWWSLVAMCLLALSMIFDRIGGTLWKSTFAYNIYISWTLQSLFWVLLRILHCVIPGFSFDLLFIGHRGQMALIASSFYCKAFSIHPSNNLFWGSHVRVQIPSNLHNINTVLLSPITAPRIYISSTIPCLFAFRGLQVEAPLSYGLASLTWWSQPTGSSGGLQGAAPFSYGRAPLTW